MLSRTAVSTASRAAPRVASRVLAACVVLSVLSACGGASGGGGAGPSASTTRDASGKDGGPVATPRASHAPARGKGSKDPDDVNGDGYRDLLLPVVGRTRTTPFGVAVVFGSAEGLDPETRVIYDYADLGVDPLKKGSSIMGRMLASDPTTADLDGDGYPDFVLSYDDQLTDEQDVRKAGNRTRRVSLHVLWGGPEGPPHGRPATALRVPAAAADKGLNRVVRGDFDGDGHHDLAAMRGDNSAVTLLYGPFSRTGEPARTDTRPGTEGAPGANGVLIADAVVPSGKSRATGLVVHVLGDGQQTASVLYTAGDGSGLSRTGKELREGSGVTFGDFDGDGLRDVAAGDSGSRNDEPGYESEAPDVAGSLTVYPGDGGDPWNERVPKRRHPFSASGAFWAADPDGDGREALLVTTDDGVQLIDGDRRTEVTRLGPARHDGQAMRHSVRLARPAGVADFDGDGKDELIMNWADPYTDPPASQRVRTDWWIVDGSTGKDRTTFSTAPFVKGR